MATVTAFIKSKKERTKVRFEVYQSENKPKLYYTSEIEVKTKYWSKKEQGISSRTAYVSTADKMRINTLIFERKKNVMQAYLSLTETSSKLLTAAINKRLNNVEAADGIQSLLDIFLAKSQYKKRRAGQFRGLRKMLTEFETASKIKINIHTFNDNTISNFFAFISTEKRGHNYKNNILKKLRTFCIWLVKNGYTTNNPFLKYSIPADIYGTPYYLTLEERNRIYNYDFSTFTFLSVQRDIFIFQCCTGCRVGDLFRLTKENIINNAVEYIAQKTIEEQAKTIRVPLNKLAADILEKYKDYDSDRLFPFSYAHKYNNNIKKIFTAAGITRKVTVINPRTMQPEQHALNEIASSHIARRTFIGNLYRQVKDPNLVGALSGHKEGSKAFARYRDIDEEMKIELVKLIE